MDLDPPYLVLYALAAVEFVVWLCAFQFMLRTARLGQDPEPDAFPQDLDTSTGTDLVTGSAEVEGRPAELAARAAASLARQGPTSLGLVKIDAQTDDRVAFTALEHMGGRLFRRGEMQFRSASTDRTHITYAVVVPSRHWLLVLGWVFVALGLVAIVTGFALLVTLVAPNPNPGAHWQTLQMIQAIHFIWPPFLFGGLYRRLRGSVKGVFDGLVHNLPYLQP